MNEVNFFPPAQIAQKFCEAGVGKCKLSFKKMFLLAILAGVFIAFGGQLFLLVTADSTMGFGFTRFLGGSVFTVGLMMVVVGGAELFTGNNLVLIAALNKRVTWMELIRSWIIVYIGNFAGSILIAAFLYWGGTWALNGNLVGATALKVGASKVSLTFAQAFFRGILCNWLVCMAVWMAMSSKDVIGKLFAIYFPIMAFVASGFEHSIANMFFLPYAIFLKGISKVVEATGKNVADFAILNWGTLFTKNLIPVTIGNIVGGAIFVGMVYWFVYLKTDESKK